MFDSERLFYFALSSEPELWRQLVHKRPSAQSVGGLKWSCSMYIMKYHNGIMRDFWHLLILAITKCPPTLPTYVLLADRPWP